MLIACWESRNVWGWLSSCKEMAFSCSCRKDIKIKTIGCLVLGIIWATDVWPICLTCAQRVEHSVTCCIQNWSNGKRKIIQCNCIWIQYFNIARLLNSCNSRSFVKQAVQWWCVSVFKAGHGQDFLEPLSEAKKAGLKLALHLSEVKVFFSWSFSVIPIL